MVGVISRKFIELQVNSKILNLGRFIVLIYKEKVAFQRMV